MKLARWGMAASLFVAVAAGCTPGAPSATPAPSGPGPGNADLSGTLTWTLNSRESDPEHLNHHEEWHDTVVLNFAFNRDATEAWVDAGSSFTRNGTASGGDDLCEKQRQWSGGGPFAGSGSYLEVFVDEATNTVTYDSQVEADMTGTATCDPTSFGQGGAEWVENPLCGRDDGREVFTGARNGVIGADGRTVTFDCTAVLDTVLNETGTAHEEWHVTGVLTLAP